MKPLKPRKMGRPPIDNPKDTQIAVRLDQETNQMLEGNAEHYQETKAESVRRGIREVNKAIKK